MQATEIRLKRQGDTWSATALTQFPLQYTMGWAATKIVARTSGHATPDCAVEAVYLAAEQKGYGFVPDPEQEEQDHG